MKVVTLNGQDQRVWIKTFDVLFSECFNMFEPLCPLRGIKVRAYDIDTYNDYVRVAEITKDWKI